MKKRRYLWHVFLLLKAPIRMRRDVVRELSGLLSDKMEQGRTMEEAITEIGSAREIAEVYKEMEAGRNHRYRMWMIVCILIAVLLVALLCFDVGELAEGYRRIREMVTPGETSFLIGRLGIGGCVVKILIELACLIFCIANIIRNKQRKREQCAKKGRYDRKKIGYLIRIFFHMHTTMKQKCDYLRMIGNSLDEKLAAGKTMEEAISILGSAREVAEEYNDVGRSDKERYRIKMWIWMVVMMIIGVLLTLDVCEWIRGYSIVEVWFAPYNVAFSTCDVNETKMSIKVAGESVGFVVCVFHEIKYIWKQKSLKRKKG